jgi:hypothetical protein
MGICWNSNLCCTLLFREWIGQCEKVAYRMPGWVHGGVKAIEHEIEAFTKILFAAICPRAVAGVIW